MGVGDGVDADTEDEYDAEEDVIDDCTFDFLLPEHGVLLNPGVIRVGCAVPDMHLDCNCCRSAMDLILLVKRTWVVWDVVTPCTGLVIIGDDKIFNPSLCSVQL